MDMEEKIIIMEINIKENFKIGLSDGNGIYYYTNGSKYVGQFKNYKQNGYGILYHVKVINVKDNLKMINLMEILRFINQMG